MIRLLIQARHATFVAVALAFVLLLACGRRVGYEQSINSFFAEADPSIVAYQEASRSFGDDNFVFVAYDDPALLTPGGMDRVAELARAVGPGTSDGVLRVESLDAMPVFWEIDAILAKLDRLPTFARTLALNTARRSVKNLDLQSNTLTIGGLVRQGTPEQLAALPDQLTHHPLFVGTLIDRTSSTTPRRVMGFSAGRIVFRHLLPNAISPILVYWMTDMALAILLGSSLGYLGLGAQPPEAEWGVLIADGKNFMATAWWMSIFPGIAIVVAGTGFSLLGDGLAGWLRRRQ